jgi:hypothetical protein
MVDLLEARRRHREQGRLLREAERTAGITPGEKHRQLMAERSREASRQNAEVGPPPPRDEQLYQRYRNDLYVFLSECFPESLGLSPLSPDHHRIIERLQEAILHGGQELIIMPRGFAKSTIVESTAIWAGGYGHRSFFVPLAATDEMAKAALDSLQYEFETNEALMLIFPEACHAARALEGVPQRAGKQTIDGRLTRIEWSCQRCVLPTVNGFPGSGAIIWPRSIVAKGLRGTRFKRPDGKQARPDFIMADDLQTDESAESAAQTRKRFNILNRTVLRMGGHTSRLAIALVGTIIEPDDLVDQLSDHDKHPAWRSIKVPMLKALPAALDEWLGPYAETRMGYNPDDDQDKSRAEREANDYYVAHRARLDAGAVATWESCYDTEHELSAIQHAMNIWIDSGEDAFMAECQNTPIREATSLELLSAEQICRKQSAFPRGCFPAECTTLTAFVDVHPSIYYCEIWAWEPNFTGYMIDSFTLPDQKRKYFSHRKHPRRLKQLYARMDSEATATAALNALLHGDEDKGISGLMQREWTRHDGVLLRIRCCLVDANGELRDVVVRVLSRSPFAASLHPSFGKGIGAKDKPMSSWPNTKKQRNVGPEWLVTKGRPGEVPGIQFDTNYWKMRFHRAMALPDGSQGALYLHKTPPNDHRLAADHYLSENPTEVTVGSRTVHEFKIKPNADNHRLDCAVGNMVAASRCGITNVKFNPLRKSRSRRRTIYYG